MTAMTKASWSVVGIALIAGGAAFAIFAVRAAFSQRVFDHLYKQESWLRRKVHVKAKDPVAYRRGLRLGFCFAALWGVAAVAIGVAIIASDAL